jgi:transposase-like protein
MVEVLGTYFNNRVLLRRIERLRMDLLATVGEIRPPEPLVPLPPRPQPLADREEAALAAAYRGGATVYELAAGYGIHRQTVSRVLESHGVARRYNQFTPEQRTEARRLRREGWTIARLAAHYGLPTSTMYDQLRRG